MMTQAGITMGDAIFAAATFVVVALLVVVGVIAVKFMLTYIRVHNK